MSLSKPTSIVSWIFSIIVMFAFAGLITSCVITIGIWPGEVKLLAPFFCTDAQPDAFVVADTYHPEPGETVTNFSLYCMGPRGDATDHGFMKPFLMISVIHGLIIVLPMLLLTSVGRFSSKQSSSAAGASATDDDPFGGFGDFSEFSDSDDSADADESHDFSNIRRDPSGRSPAPPGSTPGPFVD